MTYSTQNYSQSVRAKVLSPRFWKQPGLWFGSGIALLGFALRGRVRLALLGTGGAMLYLQATRTDGSWSHGNVLLQCTPEEAYRFWHDFQNLPKFMRHVQAVEATVDGGFRCLLRTAGSGPAEATVEITKDLENSLIEWRSTPGCVVNVAGSVQFLPAITGRGTIVSARMHYPKEAVSTGFRFVGLVERKPEFLMIQDLRRFKALMEAGEIPTTDGQPHGPRTLATAAKRILDPAQPVPSRSKSVDIAEQRRIA
jgi:uncharacterized membrane protein